MQGPHCNHLPSPREAWRLLLPPWGVRRAVATFLGRALASHSSVLGPALLQSKPGSEKAWGGVGAGPRSAQWSGNSPSGPGQPLPAPPSHRSSSRTVPQAPAIRAAPGRLWHPRTQAARLAETADLWSPLSLQWPAWDWAGGLEGAEGAPRPSPHQGPCPARQQPGPDPGRRPVAGTVPALGAEAPAQTLC